MYTIILGNAKMRFFSIIKEEIMYIFHSLGDKTRISKKLRGQTEKSQICKCVGVNQQKAAFQISFDD